MTAKDFQQQYAKPDKEIAAQPNEKEMSITVIHESMPVARKQYNCQASTFLGWIYRSHLLTFADKRALVKAKQNGYKIQKGQVYVRQFNTADGHTWTFRAIPEIHNICCNLDLYPD